MSIAGKIRIFNAAYKIAWDLSIERKIILPGLALRISDAVKASMKESADPLVIAEEAINLIRASRASPNKSDGEAS